jgi:Undecaprenyl-phosphate galactose phosphotransferase WbaP
LLGGGLRTLLYGSPMFPRWSWLLPPVWWCAALAIRLLPGWGLGAVEELRRTVLLLVAVFAAATTALFLLHSSQQISRFTVSIAFLCCLPLLPYTRVRLKAWLVKRQLWGMPCLVYGDAVSVKSVLAALRQEPGLGYVPVAVHTVGDEPDADFDGIPIAPADAMRGTGAMAAILALHHRSPQRLLELVEGPLAAFQRVIVVPDFLDTPVLWGQPKDLGGVPGVEISRTLQDWWGRAAKRTFDIALLVLLSPLWLAATLVIAILIAALDRQNPFFIHRRLGMGGREFPMWKFRTMRAGAEERLRKQLGENDELRRQWEANFKLPDDPRVTPLGRFLRRTSLDELPQFLNVLRGEMSVVGPRPLPVYHAREIPERIRASRETVRPGMTGLWQVSGRSDAGTAGIIKSDSYYLRHWSIWLDVVILVRTFRATWQRTGAY